MKRIIVFLVISFLVANIFSCKKDASVESIVQLEDFILAIESDDKDKLSDLLIKNKSFVEPKKNDLLQLAVQNNNTDIIVLLLENGCNPNMIINNKAQDSLLSWAIRNKNLDIVRVLLEKGANSNYINKSGFSSFFLAITYLPEDDIFQFLHKSIDFSFDFNNQGSTYFTELMNKQYYSVLEYIINDPELSKKLFQDEALSIRLIYSWKEGTESIANLLLEKGLVLDNEKYPLIQEAVIDMKYKAVEWLLNNGISPTKIYGDPQGLDTYYQGTPLEVAAFTLDRYRRFSDEDEYEEAKLKMEPIINLLEERSGNAKVTGTKKL